MDASAIASVPILPTSALAARQLGRASRWRLPLLGVRSRTADHRLTSADAGPSSDCRGGEPSGDRQGDRDEGVITEEKLDNLGPRDREMLRSILELDVTTTREKTVPSWILLWSNYTAPCPKWLSVSCALDTAACRSIKKASTT